MRDGNDAGSGGSRYVSRLQCIKEAVTRHLDHLAAERPNCQVKHRDYAFEFTLTNIYVIPNRLLLCCLKAKSLFVETVQLMELLLKEE